MFSICIFCFWIILSFASISFCCFSASTRSFSSYSCSVIGILILCFLTYNYTILEHIMPSFLHIPNTEKCSFYALSRGFIRHFSAVKNRWTSHPFLPDGALFSVRFPAPVKATALAGRISLLLPRDLLATGISSHPEAFCLLR